MIVRRRGPSLRVSLTLSYAGFLVVAGVVLFAVGLLALRFVPSGDLLRQSTGGWAPGRGDLTDVFVKYAGWALAALVVVGLVGGWFLSGWMLAPLGRITEVVGRADAGTLHRRIGLRGRRNELTDLADAFDDMLDRIERAVAEESRFAANASHELRTPHAVIRTIVEVARADPEGRDLDIVLSRIAETNERAIVTTEALLELARAGRAGLTFEPVDLAAVAARVVADARDDEVAAPHRAPPSIRVEPGPAVTHGNAALLGQLVSNLVINAMVHNVAEGGEVAVRTRTAPDGSALLEVANTGPDLDPARVATLTEPFVRAGDRTRAASDRGVGLGLTIVSTIVRSHRGDLRITPRDGGGLLVRVALPGA
ncbi:HAMP domain-containing sensor histidine kinase [Microbacterium sp. 2P01SA-2]|uniref:sensor histidine kinase n=1 Tax=unclassified Microbacterium TaxID=2609290 RepID=UPI0039A19EC3